MASAAGSRLAAMLLGAACVAWTVTPVLHTGLAQLALVVAIVAVVAGALRLAFIDVPQPEDQFFLPGYLRTWLTFLQLLRTPAWEETAVVAILWLEIQHPLRAWHTAALGAGLFAYLLATHIAESGAGGGPAAPPPLAAVRGGRLPAGPRGRLRDDPGHGPGRGLGDSPGDRRRRGHRRHGPGPAQLKTVAAGAATFRPAEHL